MSGTVRAFRCFQNRFHARGAHIVVRAGGQCAVRRSVNTPLFPVPLSCCHGVGQCQQIHVTSYVGQETRERDVPPGTEDMELHKRFIACVENAEASEAIGHFATIACSDSPLVSLRRRQLLVMLCSKGMVRESSDLLTSATMCNNFDGQDMATMAAFMYVIHACMQHGELSRAVGHFQQASKRGIALDLPLCEDLAGFLFLEGLERDVDGLENERAAWDVLEYIRKQGMFHGTDMVCDLPLVRATGAGNLSFALRMCDYMDREGLRPGTRALQKLHELAASSMERDPSSTAAEMLSMILEGWAESALAACSHREVGIDDREHQELLEEEGVEPSAENELDVEVHRRTSTDDGSSHTIGHNNFGDVADYDDGERSDGLINKDGYGNGEVFVLDDGEMRMTHDELLRVTHGSHRNQEVFPIGASSNVFPVESLRTIGDPDSAATTESRDVSRSIAGSVESERNSDDIGEGGSGVDSTAGESIDWGGTEFQGDLATQLHMLHPDKGNISFRIDVEDEEIFGSGEDPTYGGGDAMRYRGDGGGPYSSQERPTAVFDVHVPVENQDGIDDDEHDVVTIRLLLRGHGAEEALLRNLLRHDDDEEEDDDDDGDLDP